MAEMTMPVINRATMVAIFFMSNNGAAIGTMLKTFIASIRSDKAVKELGKLGIAVKEVQDGVEKFRDTRKIIIDIALKTKYTENDIQKPLLAVAGGRPIIAA